MGENRLPLDRLNLHGKGDSAAQERFSDEQLRLMRLGVAQRLKDAFNTENVSEIARRLKSSPGVVKPYADSDRFPSHEILYQFNRVTGYSIHWLMTGEGERSAQVERMFTEEEEEQIQKFAQASRLNFNAAIRKLATSALKFWQDF